MILTNTDFHRRRFSAQRGQEQLSPSRQLLMNSCMMLRQDQRSFARSFLVLGPGSGITHMEICQELLKMRRGLRYSVNLVHLTPISTADINIGSTEDVAFSCFQQRMYQVRAWSS